MSRRAVEQRRDLLRSSTWGPSCHIDARGTLVTCSGTGAARVTNASVPRREGHTLYAAMGDAFAWGCALLVAWRFRHAHIKRAG